MNYPEAYLVGIQLFNRGDYFDAHEVWEDAWNDAVRSEKNFYKGLIQASVALCHFYNGNVRGATRLFHSSNSLLGEFLPSHQGLNIAAFQNGLTECFDPVLNASGDWIHVVPVGVPRIDLHPAPQSWPNIEDYDAEVLSTEE